MINQATFELLTQLASTQSPRVQLALLHEYLIKEGNGSPPEDIEYLLTCYKQRVADKTQQGLNAVAQRKEPRFTKCPSDPWIKKMFFPDGRGNYPCAECGELIQPGPVFKHKPHGKYAYYHVLCLDKAERNSIRSWVLYELNYSKQSKAELTKDS